MQIGDKREKKKKNLIINNHIAPVVMCTIYICLCIESRSLAVGLDKCGIRSINGQAMSNFFQNYRLS